MTNPERTAMIGQDDEDRMVVAGFRCQFIRADEKSASGFIECRLTYRRETPYGVRLGFLGEDGKYDEKPWFFARELLCGGLELPQGLADVQVFPSRDGDGRSMISVRLSSPTGRATIVFGKAPLRVFLMRAERLVPRADEVEEQYYQLYQEPELFQRFGLR
jgi:hypothetical protein